MSGPSECKASEDKQRGRCGIGGGRTGWRSHHRRRHRLLSESGNGAWSLGGTAGRRDGSRGGTPTGGTPTSLYPERAKPPTPRIKPDEKPAFDIGYAETTRGQNEWRVISSHLSSEPAVLSAARLLISTLRNIRKPTDKTIFVRSKNTDVLPPSSTPPPDSDPPPFGSVIEGVSDLAHSQLESEPKYSTSFPIKSRIYSLSRIHYE
ncbi:uncharacterized protein LOC121911615 isoform X3 [Scomber scombrus]|uniref:Uncharacterized protein LOC121911615 isoform X3 n=1 Tax=Scomber scombrus TaxID=13677 RepID=A0AAV1PYW1_SCOSC